VGKLGILAVALLMLGTARCYNADLVAAAGGIPVVGAMFAPAAPPAPKYVSAIGTPAPSQLPDSDMKTWFSPQGANGAAADPYDVTTWRAVAAFAAASGTKAGWAEVCKKAADAAGADRTASPALGALACSADGTVTGLQRFAVELLAMRAEVAFYIKGAPGSSLAAIQARQGQLRLECTTGLVSRQGGAGSPFGQACALALATAYLGGDAPATFTALGDAYTAVAAELAKRDPKIAQEPSYFEPSKK